jgi:hypothetical protein
MPSLPMSPVESLSLDAGCPWEKRACFSAGLGCPSFGGQRAVRGNSSLLLTGLVTCRRSSLFAERPRSHAVSTFSVSSMARVSAASRLQRLPGQWRKQHCRGWPNLEHQMPEVPIRRRRASGPSSQSSSAVAVSRSSHPLAQPGSPNPSVKGTSRKRAAPYVER